MQNKAQTVLGLERTVSDSVSEFQREDEEEEEEE